MALKPGDRQHGTINGYTTHGCRCDACSAVMSAYYRRTRTSPCPQCGGPKDQKAMRCSLCANAQFKPKGEKRDERALTGAERSAFGAVVTCVRVDEDAETRTIVGHGTAVNAVRWCCGVIDTWEGDWRIRTISTPVTIIRDLEGARPVHTPSPEVLYLRKAGRLELALKVERPPSSETRPEHRRGRERRFAA